MNLILSYFRPALVCALILLTAGCQPATDQNTEQADLEAIQAQALAFSAAYVRGDVDALVAIYTEDGMAAPSGRDFIVGREAMKPYWTLPASNRVLRHKTTATSLVIDGDHAYDWGIYEGQSAVNGDTLPPFSGKYVIVWERGEDGVWRMAADMWNSLPAPQTD